MDSELRSLIQDVLDDPNKLENLTDEQILDLQKGINPYARTLEANHKYTCLSFTNLREKYMRRVQMVSIVSFLYRMLFEYNEPEEDKAVIKKFLNRWFDFDPEVHVRSAQRENSKDPERKKLSRADFMKKYPGMIPDVPTDTFFRWNYYEEVNFEEIREMVNVLYCEKPDLDVAINIFGLFNTEKDALKYKDDHLDELMTDLHVVQNGQWALMGDFKENRKRLDFYNKNTQIIKAILDQNIEDGKIAKELMHKRISRDKKKNVEEAGPDDPGLKNYSADYGTIRDKGGKQALTDAERRKIALDCGYVMDAEGNFIKKDSDKTDEELLKETLTNMPGVAPEFGGAASSKPFEPPRPDIDPDDLIDDGKNLIVPVYTTDGDKFTRTSFLTRASAPGDTEMPQIVRK
jgi:hypothetical protein